MPTSSSGWDQDRADLGLAGRRILVIFGLVVLGTILISMRFFFLQVTRRQHYLELAENNRMRLIREPALRGEIRDRYGRTLVSNQASYDLTLTQEDLGDLSVEEVLARLAELVNMDLDYARERLAEVGYRKFRPVTIKRHLTFEEVVRVESRTFELPGVEITLSPRRAYLYHELCAHVLGYIGAITREEAKRLADKGYLPTDYVGKMGLERTLDELLRGQRGRKYVEVNVHGRVLREFDHPDARPPTPGYRIDTTIDLELQRFIEKRLAGRPAVVIAQDPRNGEILALVSSPTFDPNIFSSGGGGKLIRELERNPYKPLRNRAIQDQYPPGSMFKVVMATAGLEEHVIDEQTSQVCTGVFHLGRTTFRCWKRGGHGTVAVHEALRQSCNVFFYNLGVNLGVDKIAEWASAMGLGRRTNIQLPYEYAGTVPDREFRERRRKRLGFDWFKGDTASLSIGQGILAVTPIQALGIATTIAGEGRRYAPQLVHRMLPPGKGAPIVTEPRLAADLELDPNTVRIVKNAMWAVVNEGGTGRRAAVPGLDICGKTGTAQVASQEARGIPDDQLPEQLRDHAWFVSFAPRDEPRLALVVLLSHGGKAGAKAKLEITRDIYKFYFERLRGPSGKAQGGPSP
jgi:penicillin-binding protein 2